VYSWQDTPAKNEFRDGSFFKAFCYHTRIAVWPNLRKLDFCFGGGCMSTTNWLGESKAFVQDTAAGDRQLEEYADANLETCIDLVAGRDLYSGEEHRESGARMVVNISSVHIPAFCEASRKGEERPYKNGYDLGKFRLGTPPPSSEPNLRGTVDAALPLNGVSPADVYFGAVELFGSGIRFYGDVCLVLKKHVVAPGTLVMDRNSFDLISAPLRDRINNSPSARALEAQKLAGRWKKDVGAMAALRVMEILGLRRRRYTSGQIAETIRQDEDYIEVIKQDSFGALALQEARLSANDAAYDSFTAERTAYGPPPRLESLMWRDRRRVAEQELQREDVTVRVVTSSGRSRD
jgi:hypothetical protein